MPSFRTSIAGPNGPARSQRNSAEPFRTQGGFARRGLVNQAIGPWGGCLRRVAVATQFFAGTKWKPSVIAHGCDERSDQCSEAGAMSLDILH